MHVGLNVEKRKKNIIIKMGVRLHVLFFTESEAVGAQATCMFKGSGSPHSGNEKACIHQAFTC
jgi:hypothetical protein